MAITLLNVFYLGLIFIIFNNVKSDMAKIRTLLYGSLAFYVYYEALFTPVIIVISAISFWAGHLMNKYPGKKKQILWGFLVLILALYFPLKYSPLFDKLLIDTFKFEGLRWLYLPLGLSFYTYKTLSYVFDIYYERSLPQKSIEKYLLYVTYFPQIFCGPIMGAEEFFNQLSFKKIISFNEVSDGLRLILIGIFKKLVLANNIFLLIQAAFIHPEKVSAIEWVLISVVTRFYVYYDFGGYSDISNGVSLLFGIVVPKNFDQPFKSKSITEFWRRWHMSLSSWIKDYVYYPLVSKFSSFSGIYISLIISFIVLGFWHGSQINYILYGLVNGVAVAASTWMAKKNRGKTIPLWRTIISRTGLYLFLIFLPALLLLSHDAETFYVIVKSFSPKAEWFSYSYISSLTFQPIAIVVIQMAIVFELLLVFQGEIILEKFSNFSPGQKLMLMGLGLFIIFTFTSPVINYRFLYQGF